MNYNPLNFYLRIYWGDRMFSIGDPAHDYLLRKISLEMGRFAIEQKDRQIASGKFKSRTFEQDLRAVQALGVGRKGIAISINHFGADKHDGYLDDELAASVGL